jgi:hypothetical protein
VFARTKVAKAKMSAETKAIVACAPSRSARPSSLVRRILPAAIIAIGLMLVVGWTGLLGYALFELAELAF